MIRWTTFHALISIIQMEKQQNTSIKKPLLPPKTPVNNDTLWLKLHSSAKAEDKAQNVKFKS